MDERQLTPHSASDWLPPSGLGESAKPSDRPQPVTLDEAPGAAETAHRRSRGLAGVSVGLAILAGLAFGLLASGLLTEDAGLAPSAAGGDASLAEPRSDDAAAAAAAARRLIHRGISSRGIVEIGALSPSEASWLATAAQVRDERLDARGVVRTEVGPQGTLSLYPIDSDDRYGYLVRAAAVGAILVNIDNRAGGGRKGERRGRAGEDLRTGLSQLRAVVDGLDGSLYRRSRKLHGLVSGFASKVATDVESRQTTPVQLPAPATADVGRSITRTLNRAAHAAGTGDRVRAQRLLRSVDRRLDAIRQLTP